MTVKKKRAREEKEQKRAEKRDMITRKKATEE